MVQVQLDDVLMMNSSEMYVTVYYGADFPQNYFCSFNGKLLGDLEVLRHGPGWSQLRHVGELSAGITP